MDPFAIAMLIIFGIMAGVAIMIGFDENSAPVGSFGGLILGGVVLVSCMLYQDAHYTENSVLVQHGIACYLCSPTNATTTFVLIDKNGQQVKP